MSVTVDARGLSCPVPVIKTKEALDKLLDGEVVVLVDEEAAKENVSRLANSLGCRVKITEEGDDFRLAITKTG
jgi:tRNA 2-thiouridine synthesizing protein A